MPPAQARQACLRHPGCPRRPLIGENSTRRLALRTSEHRLYCVQGALGSRSGDGRQRCSRLDDVGPSNTARSSWSTVCAVAGHGLRGGGAVSLSSWEHQILGRIAEELAGSDPKLKSLVTGFNRLAATEEMPPRPRVTGVRRSRRPGGYRRRTRQTARASWFLMTLWFVTTAALLAVALVLNLSSVPEPAPTRAAPSRGRQVAPATDWVPCRCCRPDRVPDLQHSGCASAFLTPRRSIS